MTQVAADALGLPLDRIRFELGDSTMPPAPLQGGSGLTAALGSAVHTACQELLRVFVELAASSPASPLHGCGAQDVTAAGGRISPAQASGPAPGETYTDILARHELAELSADGASARRKDLDAEPGIFAAKFAEVQVDPDLGLVRVTRFVAAVDGGRILNPKTAASDDLFGFPLVVRQPPRVRHRYARDRTGRVGASN